MYPLFQEGYKERVLCTKEKKRVLWEGEKGKVGVGSESSVRGR